MFVADVMALDASGNAERGPEWIMLAPRGRFTARDGRSFDVNPEQLVERFNAEKVDVPVDLDHATVKKAMFGDAAPAIGWIKELAAKADGLHGRVEWLAAGLAALVARSHRYVSPSLKADDRGVVSWLHSAALVAAPALSMPAVASADPATPTKEAPMLKKIAAALGLAEDAGETACLNAISTLGQRVDKAVHDQTLATLTATTAELDGLKKSLRDDKVKAMLDGAVTEKKIVPAQRAHFETLCATDAGVESVTALLAATAPGLGASGLDRKTPPDQVVTLSAEDREIMKELGVTEEQYRKANGLAAA
ncbi:MAG: phage protease [Rhizobiaceae bacterium]